MAAIGKLGYGVELRGGATSAATTATVLLAGLTSCPPPPYSCDTVDVTHLTSPNGAREFILGLTDRGEVSFELNWVPGNATDEYFRAMQADKESRLFEISFTQVDPVEKLTFSGLLTGYEISTPIDDKMSASVTLKVTGDAVWS